MAEKDNINEMDIDIDSEKKEVPEVVKEEKKENEEYEKFCFMCHRPESVAGKMIDLPNDICVCSDCMQKSFDMMNNNKFDLSQLMNMPGVQFLNLSDMENMIPKRQQVKKKKPEEKKAEPVFNIRDIPAPHKIKAQLDDYVIGQEYAKKAISVAVYNHYKRVATNTMDEIEIEKSNMLMIGPTGSGKTYLVKTLARLLDVPLAITDATSLTEAGYIGDDIESVVSKLLAAADNDVEKAERGIIFIDEIDKIAKKRNTNQRDVSGESVQQGMLKLLEGAEVEVPVGASSKNAMVPMTMVNTKNILFICGGAFDGLEKVVEKRTGSSSLGFGAQVRSKKELDTTKWMGEVVPHDLVKYGLIPELVGRLPVITALDGLDKEALVRILTEPKNSILKQYKKLFALDKVELDFEKSALEAVAQKAIDRRTGARGLRSIMEETLTDLMYKVPSDYSVEKVIVDGETVKNGKEAKLIHNPDRKPVAITISETKKAPNRRKYSAS